MLFCVLRHAVVGLGDPIWSKQGVQRMETTAVRRPEGKVDRGWRQQQIAQMMRHGPVPHLGVRHPDDEAMCVPQRASTGCPSTNDFVPPKTASFLLESEWTLLVFLEQKTRRAPIRVTRILPFPLKV